MRILFLRTTAVFRLRVTRPHVRRPCKAFGYPVVPALYILGAIAVLLCLFAYRPATTWPGLVIVLLGLPVYWYTKHSRNSV
jgi:basic amino acid/polyamine antiporter, APA family